MEEDSLLGDGGIGRTPGGLCAFFASVMPPIVETDSPTRISLNRKSERPYAKAFLSLLRASSNTSSGGV